MVEDGRDRWRARPVVAGALRVVIVGVPLATGYLASYACLRLLRSQIADSRWWLLLVAAISVLACVGVERLTRQLLPLAALLKLSMLFPDRAPSRFKIARRAMSVEKLAQRDSTDPNRSAATAAEQALALITALTAHDRRTRGHSERVRLFTELLGEQLRLPRQARDKLRWSSLLHDIGKLQVAVEILNKPAKLDAGEWDVITAHPANGEQLLGPLLDWLGEWGGAVRHHHEKFDGTGYPDGLAGTDICRAGRVVAIADAYEVMTAHRAYKKPMATLAARAELARCAGTQFDPAFVRAFLSISLPRLLWAMGPGALLMNVPLLRAMADTANKGVLATSQSGVLTASAAAVISGVAVTTGQLPVPAPVQVAAAGQPPAAHQLPAPSSARPVTRPPAAHPRPVVLPSARPRPPAAPETPQVRPPVPAAPVPVPVPVPNDPAPPVVEAAPAVAFTWVPYPVIGTSTAAVGFGADPTAARVLCSLDGGEAAACIGSSVSYSGLSDGPHTVTVWAENAAQLAGAAITTSFTVDTQGATVSWTSTPPNRVASSTVSFGFSTAEPAALSWCSVDGEPAAECTSPLTLTGFADGPHAVSVYAIDPVGNAGPAIQAAFTVDTVSPLVSVVSAPPATIATDSATVSYTVDDPDATVWCQLDSGAATVCTGPVSLTGLADGPHQVVLHAVDAVGNAGPVVTAAFTVDTTAPVLAFTSAPSGVVPSSSVSVGFSVDDPAAVAWCSLDGAPSTACASPVSFDNLTDGGHTISAYAVDAVGNVGAVVQANFTVSASAPTVMLTGVPPRLSNNPAATVSFAVDDPSAVAYCSLDGALPAVPCTSPVGYSGLADGPHTVDIFAVSAGGRFSATVSTSFTVDTTAPVVTVGHAPSGRVPAANAYLDYTVNDPAATVWCSVDGGVAAVCGGGHVDLTGLPSGPHTVSLYATDAAGNTGASVTAGFTMDNTAPVVTLTSTPPASSTKRSATVQFSTDDPGAVIWCSLDGAAAQRCTGSATYAGLGDGSHTISVYGVDQVGNRGATVSATFIVTAAAPVLLTTPPAKSSNKIIIFTWLPVLGLSYQYSYDGITWSPTTTNASYTTTRMKNGTYTFRLRGVDPFGTATAVASFTFQVT